MSWTVFLKSDFELVLDILQLSSFLTRRHIDVNIVCMYVWWHYMHFNVFFTLVYFQVLNFIYDILFKLLTIFIWLYRFVYIVQPCDNMSHTVAFCITIYSDCWGCSMLTLVWVSKQFENVLRICSITVAYCNKCDIVTMTVNNLSSLCHHLFPRKRPG